MKTVTINGVQYADVPHVEIPLASGGGNAKFYETSSSTIDASKVLNGYIGYGTSGQVVGTLTTPSISQDGTTKVLTIS